jgi:hypothetical protein
VAASVIEIRQGRNFLVADIEIDRTNWDDIFYTLIANQFKLLPPLDGFADCDEIEKQNEE